MFLVTDIRVLSLPLSRSICLFARTAHSTHSLLSAALRSLCSLTLFIGSLSHFAHFLMGRLEFINMSSRCKRVQWVQTHFWSSLETRPNEFLYYAALLQQTCRHFHRFHRHFMRCISFLSFHSYFLATRISSRSPPCLYGHLSEPWPISIDNSA